MISKLNLPPTTITAHETFRASRAETVRTQQAFLAELGTFIRDVATPLFRQTADHHEYGKMLLELMRSAGLEITRFHLVKCDHSKPVDPKDYDFQNLIADIPHKYFTPGNGRDIYTFVREFPRERPGEMNDRRFASCNSMWATRSCSNPSYVIWVEGKDPDGALSLFHGLLYHDLQEIAHSVWAQH